MKTTLESLGTHYGFDVQEALAFLESLGKGKRLTPAFPLPFCGAVNTNWCQGLRVNHGLLTQCTMVKCAGSSYCKTCQKQAETNEHGKPTHGTVQDRLAAAKAGETFTSPSGKKPTQYGNVIAKLGISADKARTEAAKFGWTIPEEAFEVRNRRLGRPTKRAVTKTKSAKVVETEADDLIAALVVKAKAQAAAERGDAPVESETAVAASSDTMYPTVPAALGLATSSDADEQKADADKSSSDADSSGSGSGSDSEALASDADGAAPKKRGRKKSAKGAAKGAVKAAKAGARAAMKVAKTAEREAKRAEREAKRKAAEELKAKKAAEREAKKKAAEEAATAVEPEVGVDVEPVAEPEDNKGAADDDVELSEEDDIAVDAFEHEGKTYLKDDDGVLYSMEAFERDGGMEVVGSVHEGVVELKD